MKIFVLMLQYQSENQNRTEQTDAWSFVIEMISFQKNIINILRRATFCMN